MRCCGAWVVFVAAAALGCTELESPDDTEEVPEWGCLSAPPESPQLPSGEVPPWVMYSAPIVDLGTQLPVPGLELKLCQVGDSECSPQAGLVIPPMEREVEVDGVMRSIPIVTLIVPFGAQVYLRMEAPGYLRQEYYFGGKLIGMPNGRIIPFEGPEGPSKAAEMRTSLPFTPVKASYADDLARGIGIQRDPKKAIIGVRTIGCSGNPTAGVRLKLTHSEGVPFAYLSRLALASTETDENGLAGFANVDATHGNVTVEGINPNDQTFGLMGITIRPNQMTTGEVRPFSDQYGR